MCLEKSSKKGKRHKTYNYIGTLLQSIVTGGGQLLTAARPVLVTASIVCCHLLGWPACQGRPVSIRAEVRVIQYSNVTILNRLHVCQIKRLQSRVTGDENTVNVPVRVENSKNRPQV